MGSLFLKSFIKEFFPFFLLAILFFSILSWFIFFISGITTFLGSPLTLLEYFFIEIKEFPHFFELILPFSWVFSLIYILFSLKDKNNLLAIEQAGVSLGILKKPLLFFSFFIILFLFLISEFFTFPLGREREEARERFLGINTSDKEYIFFINREKNQVLIAREFNLKSEKLREVIVLFLNSQKQIIEISKFDSLEFSEGEWVFSKGASWRKKSDFWENKDDKEFGLPVFFLDPLDLFFSGKNWNKFSTIELFFFLKSSLALQKTLPFPLIYEILLRFFLYSFYPLAVFWSFSLLRILESPSFFIAIVLSLSFNFLYTIMNLILLNLTSLGLLSLGSFLLIQSIFILFIFFSSKIFLLFRFNLME